MYNSSLCITGVAPTIAKIAGIEPPHGALDPLNMVVNAANLRFGGQKADRVFIYNPDAIALWLYKKYTSLFEEAVIRSSFQLPMLAVMPSVTPVCFASMYTGTMPKDHGIMAYEKPILKVDTLFDAYIRAGKKPVIVSTEGDSLSRIFLERDMEYHILPTADDCNAKALELIEEDRHDFILLYNSNYDTIMHRSGPEAEETMDALKHNIATYAKMHDAISQKWAGHKTFMGFCPDHGCHELDGKLGGHGLDMPADMNVIHLYDFI